jgi:DNA-binding Xre family transcriptional regulator
MATLKYTSDCQYLHLEYIDVYSNMCVVIRLRVSEMLEKRGQTLYWLWKETGVRYATLLKMQRGETTRLELPALEKLCRAFECKPGDLIVIDKATKQKRAKTARKR